MDKLIAAKSEPLWNTNNKVVSIIGGLIVLLFVLPLVGLNSFYLHLFIMIFMHAVMAQSWNVIAGFSGQISLGCLYAGIIIGLVESLGGLLIDPSFKLLYVFVIYLLVVIYKPQGLFGRY